MTLLLMNSSCILFLNAISAPDPSHLNQISLYSRCKSTQLSKLGLTKKNTQYTCRLISTTHPPATPLPRQVERKRHIGNDIVNIIFIDEASSGEETEFIPNNVKSQFTRKYTHTPRWVDRLRLL